MQICGIRHNKYRWDRHTSCSINRRTDHYRRETRGDRPRWLVFVVGEERRGTYAGAIGGEGAKSGGAMEEGGTVVDLRKEKGMRGPYTQRREAVPAVAAAVDGEASPRRSSLGGERRRGERREAGSALPCLVAQTGFSFSFCLFYWAS